MIRFILAIYNSDSGKSTSIINFSVKQFNFDKIILSNKWSNSYMSVCNTTSVSTLLNASPIVFSLQ